MRDSFIRPWLRWAALVLVFAGLVALGHATLPSVGHGTVSVDGHPPTASDLPVFVAGKDLKRLDVTFSIEAPFFRPRGMVVVPDDCVERILVNDVASVPTLGLCVYGARVVDIASTVKRGSNPARVVVHNRRGRTALDVTVRSGGAFTAFAFALLAVAAAGVLLLPGRKAGDGVLLALLLAGTALRTLYLLGTPATVRAHDADKHLDYIRYVATHWHLPPPHDGFEFYQPPFYYVLAAPLLRLEARVGAVLSDTVFHLQIFALVCSVASLWIALRTLRALFAGATASGAPAWRSDFVIGGGLLAVFLSLVFFASRINNDVLVQVTSFAGVALLFDFWRSGRTATWLAFAVCVGGGLLAKSNTYVVLALGFVCLAARRGTSLPRKAALGAALGAIVAVTAGWFVVRRFRQERGTAGLLVSNVSWLSHDVAVPNTFDALVGFHPLQVLAHPYNGPSTDVVGRQLWEYFFRSSLFGEFDFGEGLSWLSRVLLVLLALLGLVAARGWWRSLRTRPRGDLPLHALLVGSVASQFAFRVVSPYIPSQDFRYSFLLVLPFAYFVPLGLQGMPRWQRRAGLAIWAGFVACSASFVVVLWALVAP